MNLVAIAGSLRRDSLHRRLVRTAADLAAASGARVTTLELRDLAVPLYDGDAEAAGGLPEGVRRVVEAVRAADGVLLASPEYNHSVAGVTKNLLDWLSRARPYPLQGKPVLALSASPGRSAGRDGLEALRRPLEAVGAAVQTAGFAEAGRADDSRIALAEDEQAHLNVVVRVWMQSLRGEPAVAAA